MELIFYYNIRYDILPPESLDSSKPLYITFTLILFKIKPVNSLKFANIVEIPTFN